VDWTVTRIALSFETVSGLRVGVGTPGEETDAPLLRDAGGVPFVPGSSLKGVLRSSAERFLRAYPLDPPVCDVLGDDRCGGRPGKAPLPAEALARLCWVCTTFGSPHRAGRVLVGDLTCDGPVRTVIRDGVAIDRAELRAADRLKYDYEVLAPGTRLRGTIRFDDATQVDLGLLLMVCDLLDAGVVGLGGGTSRGLGQVRYLEPPTADTLRASTFRPGTAGEPEDLDQARDAAWRHLQEVGTP